MTKIVKFRHIAVIVSIIIIAIGMAVGTICHFVSNGFFNYGSEFASSYTVEATTSVVEDFDGSILRETAEEVLGSMGAYEVSFSEASGLSPNTVVYKFYSSANSSELSAAAASIEERLAGAGCEDASASYYFTAAELGGIWQLNFAAISLASAVAFQAIYMVFRYKPGMALSALATNVVAAGVYASLLAITRCPVGLEAIAFGALAVIVTLICTCLLFDKIKKSFKDEANAKEETLSLVAAQSSSSVKLNLFALVAMAAACVIVGVFAVIASPSFATLAPFGACLIAIAACACATLVFAPANYAQFSAIDRRNK